MPQEKIIKVRAEGEVRDFVWTAPYPASPADELRLQDELGKIIRAERKAKAEQAVQGVGKKVTTVFKGVTGGTPAPAPAPKKVEGNSRLRDIALAKAAGKDGFAPKKKVGPVRDIEAERDPLGVRKAPVAPAGPVKKTGSNKKYVEREVQKLPFHPTELAMAIRSGQSVVESDSGTITNVPEAIRLLQKATTHMEGLTDSDRQNPLKLASSAAALPGVPGLPHRGNETGDVVQHKPIAGYASSGKEIPMSPEERKWQESIGKYRSTTPEQLDPLTAKLAEAVSPGGDITKGGDLTTFAKGPSAATSMVPTLLWRQALEMAGVPPDTIFDESVQSMPAVAGGQVAFDFGKYAIPGLGNVAIGADYLGGVGESVDQGGVTADLALNLAADTASALVAKNLPGIMRALDNKAQRRGVGTPASTMSGWPGNPYTRQRMGLPPTVLSEGELTKPKPTPSTPVDVADDAVLLMDEIDAENSRRIDTGGLEQGARNSVTPVGFQKTPSKLQVEGQLNALTQRARQIAKVMEGKGVDPSTFNGMVQAVKKQWFKAGVTPVAKQQLLKQLQDEAGDHGKIPQVSTTWGDAGPTKTLRSSTGQLDLRGPSTQGAAPMARPDMPWTDGYGLSGIEPQKALPGPSENMPGERLALGKKRQTKRPTAKPPVEPAFRAKAKAAAAPGGVAAAQADLKKAAADARLKFEMQFESAKTKHKQVTKQIADAMTQDGIDPTDFSAKAAFVQKRWAKMTPDERAVATQELRDAAGDYADDVPSLPDPPKPLASKAEPVAPKAEAQPKPESKLQQKLREAAAAKAAPKVKQPKASTPKAEAQVAMPTEDAVVQKVARRTVEDKTFIESVRKVLADHPDWGPRKIADHLGVDLERVRVAKLDMLNMDSDALFDEFVENGFGASPEAISEAKRRAQSELTNLRSDYHNGGISEEEFKRKLPALQAKVDAFTASPDIQSKPVDEVKPEQSAAPESAPVEAKPILIETPDGTKQVSIVNVENGTVTFRPKGSKKEITWPEDRFRALARGADLETTKVQVQQAIDDFKASKAAADTSMSARIEEAKKPGVEPEVDKGAPASLKPIDQKWEAKTPDRSMTASGHYAVVELDDLVTSHDPFRRVVNDNFPQQYQTRDRASVVHANQEQKIASGLNPPEVLDDTRWTDDGAPIINQNSDFVESGNGRGNGFLLARKDYPERWAAYKADLVQRHPEAAGMKDPVLVRVRENEFDPASRREFVKRSNARRTAGSNSVETALSDVDHELFSKLDTSVGKDFQGVLSNAKNRPILDKFFSRIPANERVDLTTNTGGITKDGWARVRAAGFSTLLGKDGQQFLKKATEEGKIGTKYQKLVNGIDSALGDLLVSRGKEGGAAVGEVLNEAIDEVSSFIESGYSLERWKQRAGSSYEISPEGKRLADSLLDEFGPGGLSKGVSEKLKAFADNPDLKEPDSGQISMFDEVNEGQLHRSRYESSTDPNTPRPGVEPMARRKGYEAQWLPRDTYTPKGKQTLQIVEVSSGKVVAESDFAKANTQSAKLWFADNVDETIKSAEAQSKRGQFVASVPRDASGTLRKGRPGVVGAAGGNAPKGDVPTQGTLFEKRVEIAPKKDPLLNPSQNPPTVKQKREAVDLKIAKAKADLQKIVKSDALKNAKKGGGKQRGAITPPSAKQMAAMARLAGHYIEKGAVTLEEIAQAMIKDKLSPESIKRFVENAKAHLPEFMAKPEGHEDVFGAARKFDTYAPETKWGKSVDDLADAGSQIGARTDPDFFLSKMKVTVGKGRLPSDTDVAVMAFHMRNNNDTINEILNTMIDAGDDFADEMNFTSNLERAMARQEDWMKVARNVRGKWHRLGQALQVTFDTKYEPSKVMLQAQAMAGGEIPSWANKALQGNLTKIKEARKLMKTFADEEFLTIKPGTAKKAEYDALRDDLSKAFGFQSMARKARRKTKQGGFVGIGFLPQKDIDKMRRELHKLLADQVRQGKGSLDEAIAGVLEDMTLSHQNVAITPESLIELLSGKFKETLVTVDLGKRAIDRAMRKLTDQAKFRQLSTMHKAGTVAGEVVTGLQKQLQTGIDLSFAFMQGLPGLVVDPAGWGRAWKQALQPMFGKIERDPIGGKLKYRKGGFELSERLQVEMQRDPMYQLALKAGVSFTDEVGPNINEEIFQGQFVSMLRDWDPQTLTSKIAKNVADDVGLRTYAELIGRSNEGYTHFLNNLRLSIFKKMATVGGHVQSGDSDVLADAAALANILTGRGSGKIANFLSQKPAAALFYAPRFAWSTYQNAFMPVFITPTMKSRRGQIASGAVWAKQMMLAYGMMKASKDMFGLKVEDDPRSPNFGTIEIGGRQVQLFKKLLEPYHIPMALYGGSFTAKDANFNPHQEGTTKLAQYASGKSSPAVRLALQMLVGERYDKRIDEYVDMKYPRDLAPLAQEQLLPIAWQEWFDPKSDLFSWGAQMLGFENRSPAQQRPISSAVSMRSDQKLKRGQPEKSRAQQLADKAGKVPKLEPPIKVR